MARSAEVAQLKLRSTLGRVSDAKEVIVLVDTGDIRPEVVTVQPGLNVLHDACDELDAAIGKLARQYPSHEREQD